MQEELTCNFLKKVPSVITFIFGSVSLKLDYEIDVFFLVKILSV